MSIIKQKYHLYDDEYNGILRQFNIPGSHNHGPPPNLNINTSSINIDFVYIHIPKTGGTSVHRLLGGWDTTFDLREIGQHRSISSIEWAGTDGNGNLYDPSLDLPLVYFVRNPYDRLVSSYHHAASIDAQIDSETLYKNFDSFVQKLTNTVKLIEAEELTDTPLLYTGIPGAQEYVIYLDKERLDPVGGHTLHSSLWNSQSSWVKQRSKPFDEHYYKFENIHNGFDEIVAKFLNMPNIPKLPHLNKSVHRRPYQEYYTNPRTAVSVYRFYKKDFETFGYSPNII